MIYQALKYGACDGGVDQGEVEFFDRVCFVLSQIPEMDGLSCHSLAQFVSDRWGLRRVDGYFGCRGWEHSWNVFGGGRLILDAYPIGGVRPILVLVGDRRSVVIRPWRSIYIPAKLDLRGRGKPSPEVVSGKISRALKRLGL